MSNFVPKDQITWVTTGGATYTNDVATIVNAWGYTENTVQQLTFAAGKEHYLSVSTTGYTNQTLVVKCWVKLGTATNWNLSVNNAQTWNTGGGKTFT